MTLRIYLTLLLLIFAARSVPCRAGYVAVTSLVDQNADQYVDWGDLGASSNDAVPTLHTLPATGGIDVTYAIGAPSAHFLVQAGAGQIFPPYWNGNFLPGDNLLTSLSGSNLAMTLSFSTPILGAGTQIQRNGFGSFVAQVEAFDAEDNLLASFTEMGNSSDAKDGSAIYLGVLGETASIASIRYSLVSGNQFAINRVYVAVPEPGAAALALCGCALLSAWRPRHSRTRKPTCSTRKGPDCSTD